MATTPIDIEPAGKSRLAGDGATRVYSVPLIVGTTNFVHGLAPRDDAVQNRPAETERTEEAGERRLESGSYLTHGAMANASTTPRSEFSPSLMYVRSRLLQMRERSKYELAPYPGEVLLANAWYHADGLLMPGTPAPSVVPSEDGNVSFVWHRGGWEIEIEIDYDEAEIWADHASGESWSGSVWQDLDQLRTLLRGLTPED